MTKTAVLITCDTRGDHSSRLVKALRTVREFKRAGEEVYLIFEGAGTKWAEELSDPEHRYAPLYRAIGDQGCVCAECAARYQIRTDAAMAQHESAHPISCSLLDSGYTVISF